MESGIRRSRIFVSNPVSTKAGSRFGLARLSMVSQNTRQLRIQNTASRLTSRSAVRNRACSARQPDFRILWKTLDLPAHGVPLQLLHGGVVAVDRQVGDQLPVDAGAPDRLFRLPGVQHREHERRIALLFGDRWPDGHASVGEFNLRGAKPALVVADGDPVAARGPSRRS